MRILRAPHSWRLTPRAAIRVQQRLAPRVSHSPTRSAFRYVAGLDAAFSSDGRHCIAGVVLWDTAGQTVIEEHVALRPLTFPYIPGLLSFREVPALLAAIRKLHRTPDALMCDGQGLAHPRRFGIACHVGVICQLPAIGCAKSRLLGTHGEVPAARGSHVPLRDGKELIGEVLRTQDGVNPLFVSIGHRVSLAQARRIVLRCSDRFRLPEPTRLADRLVARAKHSLTKTD